MDVAVTFDDLPGRGPEIPGIGALAIHEELTRVFRRDRLPPITGFVNGKPLEDRPGGRDALRCWMTAGNRIGNHTYGHLDLGDLVSQLGEQAGIDMFLADIERNEAALRELSGDDRSWRIFRYPFLQEGAGAASRVAIRSHLTDRGYRIAPVTIKFGDWIWDDIFAECIARGRFDVVPVLEESYLRHARASLAWARDAAALVFGRPIAHVLLLHAGVFQAHMMSELTSVLRAEGARFIELDAALSDPALSVDPALARSFGQSLLEQLIAARNLRYPLLPRPQSFLPDLLRPA